MTEFPWNSTESHEFLWFQKSPFDAFRPVSENRYVLDGLLKKKSYFSGNRNYARMSTFVSILAWIIRFCWRLFRNPIPCKLNGRNTNSAEFLLNSDRILLCFCTFVCETAVFPSMESSECTCVHSLQESGINSFIAETARIRRAGVQKRLNSCSKRAEIHLRFCTSEWILLLWGLILIQPRWIWIPWWEFISGDVTGYYGKQRGFVSEWARNVAILATFRFRNINVR